MPKGKKSSKEECAPAKARSPVRKMQDSKGDEMSSVVIHIYRSQKKDGSGEIVRYIAKGNKQNADGNPITGVRILSKADAESKIKAGWKTTEGKTKAKTRKFKQYKGKPLTTSGQVTRLVNRRRNSCMKRCEEDSVSLSASLTESFGNLPSSPPRKRKTPTKKAASAKPASKKKAAAKPKSKTAATKKNAAKANKENVCGAKKRGRPAKK